jgi:hypothetical protein
MQNAEQQSITMLDLFSLKKGTQRLRYCMWFYFFNLPWESLKGQCHEIFDPRFFSLKHPPWALFEYKLQFAKKFEFFKIHAVSLTPHARCMRCLWHRMHRCMRCHWHRMHSSCGVIDTACSIKFSNTFEKWKSYAKRRGYAKKLKLDAVLMTPHALHAGSMTPHVRCMRCHWQHMQNMTPQARSTNHSNGPGAFKGNREYLSKTYMFLNCPTPPLKGLPNKQILRSKIDHISVNSKQNSKRL